ncbi:hypothetical protein KPH14_005486 [Odynerus spinipes]|uniref:Uncharacterized protein n=1 Tax=Odynerus spinipes TaxID=1348599 RepID=A0AAD9RBS4_9HYME|nr:hypothetical protein KPH14_005486 [Odynerus spinipes]
MCTNEECYVYAKYVTKSMNRYAEPCTDFYEYVCGRKKNPLESYYPSWSTTINMSLNSAKQVKEILEKKEDDSDSEMLKKAKRLHAACMDLPYLGMFKAHSIQTYIQASTYFPLMSDNKSGSQKRKSWVEIHNYYFSMTSDSGLFEIFINTDHHELFNPLLHLVPVYSPFGRIIFAKPLKGELKNMYEEYLKAVLFSVFSYNLLKVSSKILKQRLEAIVAFRRELYTIQAPYPHNLKPTDKYNRMRVSELEEWYKNMNGEGNLATVPWVNVIYSLYDKNKPEEIIKKMPINVVAKSYHEALVKLINKTPNEIIVNHLHLYFIETHLEYNTFLQDAVMHLIFYDGKLSGSLKYPGKKWHTCILSNSMTETIGKAYIQKYFPPTKKRQLEQYTMEIKNVLELQIRDSKWMDGSTMRKFTNVTRTMKVIIGYPEFYDNEVLRFGYYPVIEPGNIEAYYCPSLNRLIISAATFQLPVYDPNLSKTVLYGSTGMLIAHELHHAFSPYALQHCHTFKLSELKQYAYKERINCFKKKYNKLHVKELREFKPSPTINGKKTLEENVADAMGLKVAYEAFRKHVWESGVCALVPLYQGITCEQLFFIAFAATLCSDTHLDVLVEETMKESHSPPRIRVNEAVSNMKEFSKAFDCPKKTPMNTENRCDLWK